MSRRRRDSAAVSESRPRDYYTNRCYAHVGCPPPRRTILVEGWTDTADPGPRQAEVRPGDTPEATRQTRHPVERYYG